MQIIFMKRSSCFKIEKPWLSYGLVINNNTAVLFSFCCCFYRTLKTEQLIKSERRERERRKNWLKVREGKEKKKLVWAYGLEAGKSCISCLYIVMITCCFRHDEKARMWTEHVEREIHRLNFLRKELIY